MVGKHDGEMNSRDSDQRDIRPNLVIVWKEDRMVVLEPGEIVYCYTSSEKTVIKTVNEEFVAAMTLAALEEKLSEYYFFRTHKSYLVNLYQIREILPWFNHTYLLVMRHYEKDEVPVSRTYIKRFKEVMGI